MKKILLTLILTLTLCACTNEEELDLQAVMKEENYIIVDVRTKEEYDESHLMEAINIPYNEINKDIDLDKSKTILVYCRSGNRSSIAYETLENLGYEVYDLGAFSEIDLPKEEKRKWTNGKWI